mmetsp:Transcript_7082/g.13118  ORF Transcript_7082/g.13118 Transcript_7082/m.13118 type:complete len:217 (-) Transcript_7082:72-722(-)
MRWRICTNSSRAVAWSLRLPAETMQSTALPCALRCMLKKWRILLLERSTRKLVITEARETTAWSPFPRRHRPDDIKLMATLSVTTLRILLRIVLSVATSSWLMLSSAESVEPDARIKTPRRRVTQSLHLICLPKLSHRFRKAQDFEEASRWRAQNLWRQHGEACRSWIRELLRHLRMRKAERILRRISVQQSPWTALRKPARDRRRRATPRTASRT